MTYSPDAKHPRTKYAQQTLTSLLKNLSYDGDLIYHIADDGSFPNHVARLSGTIAKTGRPVTNSNAAGGGYGKSFNLATQVVHDRCDYLLMVEDDWELTRPFNISPLADALSDSKASDDIFPLGCIRLGYIGWTQAVYGTLEKYADRTYFWIYPESPEPHVWSGHPRLETVAYQRAVGPWPEGLNPGATEFEVAHRPVARKGVAWPLDFGMNASQQAGCLFAHIGTVSPWKADLELAAPA